MRLFGRHSSVADRADRQAQVRHQRWRRGQPLPSLVAALDLGTQKTVCIIARRERERLRVLGIGHQQSRGIKAGVIVDSAAAEASILNAVHAAEQKAGQSITSLAVVFSGGRPSSRMVSAELTLQGARVSGHHLTRLQQQAVHQAEQLERQNAAGVSRQLVACDSMGFTVDLESAILDPRGLFADRLAGQYHALALHSSALKNLHLCVEQNLLAVDSLTFAPLSAAEALLSEEDRQLGTLVIDIGAGTTSLALIAGGSAVYATSLPIGGEHITRDIAQAYAISHAAAERLKTVDGAALSFAPGQQSDLLQGQDLAVGDRITSSAELVGYIRPRCEELFEMVRDRLDQPELARFAPRRALLTGGSAALIGMDRLGSSVLGLPLSLAGLNGSARAILGLPERYQGSAFSALLGTLARAGGLMAGPLGDQSDVRAVAGVRAKAMPGRVDGSALAQNSGAGTVVAAGQGQTGSRRGNALGSWLRSYF